MNQSATAPAALRRNIELKARLADLERARDVALELATNRAGIEQQIDTYFHVANGRLKLRQINGLSAVLIWYGRANEAGPKASDYQLVPVSNPETLKLALARAQGVKVVVDKRREIYLWHNVRIHLDDVAGLGTFLEFEAVMQPDIPDGLGRSQIAELRQRFAVGDEDLIEASYSDLLLERE